jgi:hypothetical protein
MKVTLIRLNGRLGNQLFIWALCVYLSKRSNRTIYLVAKSKIDVHPYVRGLVNQSSPRVQIRVSKMLNKVFTFFEVLFLKFPKFAKNLNFLPIFFESAKLPVCEKALVKSRIISGFFQRNWIVEDNSDFIVSLMLNELSSRVKLTKNLDYTRPQVHIRRGDYELAADHWGLLSLDFYLEALKHSKNIYCFTDISKSQIPSTWEESGITFFSPEDTNELESFYHLSRGTKLVIANSSFSWWAGYLAAAKGAEVYAPQPWFKSEDSWNDEIYPSSFHKVHAKFENSHVL